ncbi:MAG: DUF1826 domain-containing protein [Nannocystales bacterium]
MHPIHALTQPASARSPQPFGELLEFGVNVLVVERTTHASVAAALDEVARGDAFEHGANLDAAQPDLEELLQPILNPVARRFLEQDIASITRDYGALLGRRHVHGQLSVVEHDGCRKLHVDHVSVRLLCTYSGPGTQWVRNEDVVRSNLARIDVDIDEANRSVLQHRDAIQQCKTGDILLLKGEGFGEGRGSGAVHRSPPIVDRELRRLVFKIDEGPCGC